MPGSIGAPEALGSRRTHRLAGLVFAVSVGAAVLIGVCSLHQSLPYNPIVMPLAKYFDWRLVLPQGWKFFTRDPQEERYLLFSRTEDGHWRTADRGVNARPSNLFGLNREGRAQGVEVGLLMQALRQVQSIACEAGTEECLRKLGGKDPSLEVKSTTPSPTLCGDVIIMFQKPLPWAWARSNGRREMPARGYRLRVTC